MDIHQAFMLFKKNPVARAEEFHGIPEKNAERSAQVGISQYSFLSKLYFNSQHRCVALLYVIPMGIFNYVIN